MPVKNSTLSQIPKCAWKRKLGDIPENAVSQSPNRGVALGGFGAGSFMYNLSGSFGPFQAFDNVIYKGEWLKSAAFHFYEKTKSGKKNVKTLSTDPILKDAWSKLNIGDADYYALQPKGWVNYKCFETELTSKFFSPIIPNNYKESSYPVGIWEFTARNPLNEDLEVSVMLTFPGVMVSERLKAGFFTNSFKEEGNIKSIVMKAMNPIGGWCIASKEEGDISFSYTTSWNTDGYGKAIWEDFETDGELANSEIDSTHKGCAICLKMSLKPGEEKKIPVVISWDFPIVEFAKGTQWWKRYTKYFDKSFDNAFKIAKESLENYKDWESKVDAWMKPVVENDKYPEWLKCAAFNELYYSQFGGIFYDAGLKNQPDKNAKLISSGESRWFETECMWYPFTNTFDVRHYSSIPFALFWPEIEKSILKDWAEAIMEFDPIEHQTPHDCGKPQDDPYFVWDSYGTNKLHWKDLHSKFIQQCWRYWYMYKDKEFLKFVWPACKATYEYMKKTDENGDGLPDNNKSDNTYDSWGLYGTSLLCGGLWVAALLVMKEFSAILDDPLKDEIEKLLKIARKNLDEQLWYKEKGYYKIDTKSKNPTAIMSDGLNGQRYCESFGLENILPKEKIKSHLSEVYKRCVVPLHDFNGDGIGECGAINGINEDGSFINIDQSDEIWTGSTYFLSASMYKAGLKDEALKTAFGVYYLCFEEESTAFWFNTPEAWHNKGIRPRPLEPEQYQRPRAVWELLLEIDNPYKKQK